MLIIVFAFGLGAASSQTTAVRDKLPDLIQSNQEQVAKFQIVSREFSADLKQAKYVLKSDMGIFRCRINLTNSVLTNLTIVVKDEKYCEGLDYQSNRGPWKAFKSAPGVSVKTDGKVGVVLQFNTEALDRMKPGGVLQFINQYR